MWRAHVITRLTGWLKPPRPRLCDRPTSDLYTFQKRKRRDRMRAGGRRCARGSVRAREIVPAGSVPQQPAFTLVSRSPAANGPRRQVTIVLLVATLLAILAA